MLFQCFRASYLGAVKMVQVFVDATISLLDRMRCVSEWKGVEQRRPAFYWGVNGVGVVYMYIKKRL